MADDFWCCPYTGGKEPCSPACVLFVREHNQGYLTYDPAVTGVPKVPNYCRTFGRVDKTEATTIKKSEDGYGL